MKMSLIAWQTMESCMRIISMGQISKPLERWCPLPPPKRVRRRSLQNQYQFPVVIICSEAITHSSLTLPVVFQSLSLQSLSFSNNAQVGQRKIVRLRPSLLDLGRERTPACLGTQFSTITSLIEEPADNAGVYLD